MRASQGADRVESNALERESHNPHRPAVSTATAAAAFGVSRHLIRRAIEHGDLPGYFISGRERRRWFAYADGLPGATPAGTNGGPTGTAVSSSDEAAEASRLLTVLLTALNDDDEPAPDELRARARRLLDNADRLRAKARHLEERADDAEARAERLLEEAAGRSRSSALREAIRQAVLPAHAGRWEGGRGDTGS